QTVPFSTEGAAGSSRDSPIVTRTMITTAPVPNKIRRFLRAAATDDGRAMSKAYSRTPSRYLARPTLEGKERTIVPAFNKLMDLQDLRKDESRGERFKSFIAGNLQSHFRTVRGGSFGGTHRGTACGNRGLFQSARPWRGTETHCRTGLGHEIPCNGGTRMSLLSR